MASVSRNVATSVSSYLFAQAVSYFARGSIFMAGFHQFGATAKIESFLDWRNRAHAFKQTVSANQVATVAIDTAFGGRYSATFTNAEYYVSTQPASYWKFLSSGAGFWVIHLFACGIVTSTRYQLSTRDATGTAGVDLGLSIISNATPNYVLNIRNDTTTFISTIMGPAVLNETTYLDAVYSETLSPKFQARKKSSLGSSGNPASAPSSANPSDSLTLCARAGSGAATAANRAIGRWVATFIRDKPPASNERAHMQKLLAARWKQAA